MKLKECSTHGLTAHRKHHDYYRCKECMNDASRRARNNKKLRAIGYLGGKCKRCGGEFIEHPTVFEFHHVNPEEKEHTPANLMSGSWEKLTAELDKCILLCANCHRIEHES